MFKEGEKIILRPYVKGIHSSFLYNWIHDERAILFTGPLVQPQSLEDIDAIYGMSLKTLMIYEKDNPGNGPIGFIAYTNRNGIIECGTIIDKKYENNGILLDASYVILDYLFGFLHINKVLHCPCELNTRMIELDKKAGMILEAVIPNEYYVHGKWYAKHQYAMYREQYHKFMEK